MLDFYREHQISPVAQDVSALGEHFERRGFLYRSVGLWPAAFPRKQVLEVGPGTGENALYTYSLQPYRLTLVEPNPTAAAVLRRRFADQPDVRVVESTIQDMKVADAWDMADIVLCEGLLGLCGGDPKALLEQVCKHVKVGGVLVITCIDAISQCADVLRRAMAHRILDRSKSLQEQVAELRLVFAPHLATLKGMTRSVDDWILDNILNPASIGPTFSIPDACEALEGHFEILGCSPRFLLDWRWYKEAQPGNQWAIESYWRNCHNLYDYRKVEPERSKAENQALMRQCMAARYLVKRIEEGLDMPHYPDPIDPAWFGRGQQYLSFVRVQ